MVWYVAARSLQEVLLVFAFFSVVLGGVDVQNEAVLPRLRLVL